MSETRLEEQVQVVQQPKRELTGERISRAIDNLIASLETTLTGHGRLVLIRVDQEALTKLDMLVAGGICKSRSEGVAFLLQRGIESSGAMFARIAEATSTISDLKQELADWAQSSEG